MNLNKVVFAGNIGRIHNSAMPDGTAVTKMRIASTKRFNDRSGEKQEKTTWMSAVAFGRKAEVIQQYFQKGSPIYIEGELDVQLWEDDHGQKRQTIEVRILEFQFVGSNQSGQQSPPARQPQPQQAPAQPSAPQTAGPVMDPFDDDLPF